MIAAKLQIAKAGDVPSALACALDAAPSLPLPVLVNLGSWPVVALLIQRCEQFAAEAAAEALIVTILTPGEAGTLEWQVAAAGAWAFTLHAALAWAPRGIRVNMIGFCASPPPEMDSLARGRSATPVRARPANVEDVVRTVQAIAGWPSMTGQMIRLGGI